MRAAFSQSNVNRKIKTAAVYSVMLLCMGIITALVFFLTSYIFIKAAPHFSLELLTTKPSYLKGTIGLLPDILNTVYLTVTAIVIVLPMGAGAAIYLNEYAQNPKIVRLIEYATETLSGIPSIIYGLVGMLVFCQFLGLKTSLLAGALTLVIMNIPIIIRTTQESLKTVPQGCREGSYGLGAARFCMIRTVVLPCCLDGIVTGCILSAGRMLGESAALLFTAGFAHTLHGYFTAITSSGATLTVALYVYAKEQGEFEVAFVIAALLIVLCLITNLGATWLTRRMRMAHNLRT